MDEIGKLKEQVKSLEKRVELLETVLNGEVSQKPGRKPKMSILQKNEIIKKHAAGSSYSALAQEFSVSKTTISNICNGYGNTVAEDDLMIPVTRC